MNTDESQWRRTIPDKLMLSNEVHVWHVLLDLPNFEIESLLRILSVDELERASKFHFEKDKKRFIASRGILRKILSHYLGVSPQMIRFEYTFYGKPVLASKSGEATLCFNLSHSNEFALYAVCQGKNIGIDIERVRDDVSVEQISQKFYSHNEISALENICKNDRFKLFFEYWTRKEALVKAIGKGISFPMEQCDVSLKTGSVLSSVIVHGNNVECSCWYVQDLFPSHGYVAAIAVDCSDCNISCFHYSLL
jgi:4'-phosphopantetheinyl transferase